MMTIGTAYLTVGVLSDTHLPKKGRTLPSIVKERLRAVDHIVHAGDLTAPFVLDELGKIAPVTAVAGNVDPPGLADQLGWSTELNLGGFQIGVTHGHLGKGKCTPDRAWNTFDRSVNIIIFGHSHIPHEEWRDGILLLNPGSATDKRRQPEFTFCILHLKSKPEVEWIRYKAKV